MEAGGRVRPLAALGGASLALEAGDTVAASEWQTVLEGELERVLEGLACLDSGMDRPSSTEADGKARAALLRRLQRLLTDRDTAAVEAIGPLERALSGSPHAAEASSIGQAIARYDFASAEARLRRMARDLGLSDEEERS